MGGGYVRGNRHVYVHDARAHVSLDRALAEEPSHRPAVRNHPEWRDRFDGNKADLLPTGTNAYIPMQPGGVLKLKHGNDSLTVTIGIIKDDEFELVARPAALRHLRWHRESVAREWTQEA